MIEDHPTGRIAIRNAVKAFDGPPVLREVSLEVSPREIVALLGPSGCGKTTLLRSIAGLERLDGGEILIDEVIVSGPGRHIRPETRRIGMVFQDWAIFPHLSVGENVAYGLERDERRSGRVDETLEMVGLAGLGDRSPSTLSGGQQQRVALARALAPRPRALLLDEPFSNLDTTLRVQIRAEVHRLLSELGITTVFVTHDQEEAFVLGDRVAVMHDGVIEQCATPAELYESPVSRWVAEFVGEANIVRGIAAGDRATTPLGQIALTNAAAGGLHGEIDLVVRPEHLLVESGATTTTTTAASAVVELVEYYGHDHVVVARLDDDQRVRIRHGGAPLVERGQRVTVRSDGSPVVGFVRT